MLSVIIPTKNEETYLPSLLNSLFSQTLIPDEIIVADAFSIDKTREVAKKFGVKIDVINGGLPAVGRNMGAITANGNILLFLDADVVLTDKNFLKESLQEFENKKLAIATCDVLPLDGTKTDFFTHHVYNFYARLWGKYLPHAAGFCLFVRKALHEEVGGFDESVLFCEDHEYTRRVAKMGRFGFLSKPVPVSARRFSRDGYFSIILKFVLAELHLIFLGPIRSDFFRYTFGHNKKEK